MESEALQGFILENHWRFTGGGLWLSGKEPGALDPLEWEKRPARVLILRLSTYEDTALSFTHNLLYALADKAGIFPDLAFLPPSWDGELLTEAGFPWIFGTKTKRPWQDFDMIAVSNSIIQELGNLFILEKKSGIPLTIPERAEVNSPLIVLGGANAPSSFILMSSKSPVDGIFIGENEQSIISLFQTLKESKASHKSRNQILEQWAATPGFIRPDHPTPVIKTHKKGPWDPQVYGQLTSNFSDGNAGKGVLPLSEGCAGFCSFCHESFVRKPYEENPLDAAVSLAEDLKLRHGVYKLDLFSFNFNMHQDFYKILNALTELFPHIGLKSQRLDSIAQDPTLIPVQKLLGKQYFTVGLEGISQEVRTFLNKNLTENQVRTSLGILAHSGVRELKIFLIATGRESEKDFLAFDELLDFIKKQPTPSGYPLKATFSVTPLVRFPHTPLEFDPFPGIKALDRTLRRIITASERKGFQARQAASAEEAGVCDLLLRPRTPDFFTKWKNLVLEKDFVYYKEIPGWLYAALSQTLAPEEFDLPQTLPWSIADTGIRRDFLQRQYEKNLEGNQTPFPERKTPVPARDYSRVLGDKLKALKSQESIVTFWIEWTERAFAIGRGYVWAYFMGIIGKTLPNLARAYRGWVSSQWEKDQDSPVHIFGDDLIQGTFLPQGAQDLEKLFSDPGILARINELGKGLFVLKGQWTGAPHQWNLEFDSPYELNSQGFLVGQGLKHTYMKTGHGEYEYRFTPDALKKRVIFGLSGHHDGNRWKYVLSPGPKFNLMDFLSKGFLGAEKGAWRCIKTRAHLVISGALHG